MRSEQEGKRNLQATGEREETNPVAAPATNT